MTTNNLTQTPAKSGENNRGPAANQPAPSPALLFDAINAYQKTAAIKAGIELDLFTPLVEGPATADALAQRCHAAARGMRILCDYLTVQGFLTKSGDRYALTLDSSVFLNRKSPAYAGGAIEFLLAKDVRGSWDELTAAVRKGGTAISEPASMTPNHAIWIAFARSMGSLMFPAAAGLAELVKLDRNRPARVLDISASHGVWGLAFATKNPNAQIVAVDWAPVLEVTRENMRKAGVADRFSPIAGNAMDVEFGGDYDVVLLPNFLHHMGTADCVRLLKKIHAALRPGGTVAILEFVPNPDRITPPVSACFSLVMLAGTPEGDAYTFAEYNSMLAQAGFNPATQHTLPASMNAAVIAIK